LKSKIGTRHLRNYCFFSSSFLVGCLAGSLSHSLIFEILDSLPSAEPTSGSCRPKIITRLPILSKVRHAYSKHFSPQRMHFLRQLSNDHFTRLARFSMAFPLNCTVTPPALPIATSKPAPLRFIASPGLKQLARTDLNRLSFSATFLRRLNYQTSVPSPIKAWVFFSTAGAFCGGLVFTEPDLLRGSGGCTCLLASAAAGLTTVLICPSVAADHGVSTATCGTEAVITGG